MIGAKEELNMNLYNYQLSLKMKAILEFDLSDQDDAMNHLRCVKSLDVTLSLLEILSLFRQEIKYNEEDPKRVLILEEMREKMLGVLEGNFVNLDELIN